MQFAPQTSIVASTFSQGALVITGRDMQEIMSDELAALAERELVFARVT